MGQAPFRPQLTPTATTVWRQAEIILSGTIGDIGASIVDIAIPKGLIYRRVYVAGGICFTGTLVPDAATDNVEHRMEGEITVRDEGTITYDLLLYHNPSNVGLVPADSLLNRTKGPWPPCVLSRPVTLANLVPKLPNCDHPDARIFTLPLKRQDSGGGALENVLAKCLPLRMTASGDVLQFNLKVTAPVAGSTWGHWIIAVESSSLPF